MDYDVKFVEYKGGNIKVSYTVTPLNSHEEASIISRIDKPHEDFMRAWMKRRTPTKMAVILTKKSKKSKRS